MDIIGKLRRRFARDIGWRAAVVLALVGLPGSAVAGDGTGMTIAGLTLAAFVVSACRHADDPPEPEAHADTFF